MYTARTSAAFAFGGLATVLCMVVRPNQAAADWPQWGGPNRDFHVETTGLADAWPEGGPERLWSRELGSGYSAIVHDDGVLYTMYRTDPMSTIEHTVALEAATGKTIWDHSNEAKYVEPPDERWGGHGPNATPLIDGDRLFAVGSLSVLHCLDKRIGQVLWKHDLAAEYGAKNDLHVGYCFSPIAHGNLVIVGADRDRPREEGDWPRDVPTIEGRGHIEGHALMAFDQRTGELAWKSLDVSLNYSSPILIDFEGKRQLVLSTNDGLLGVDPANGDLLWQHAKRGNETTPVWNGRDTVFYSSAGDGERGRAIGLKLTNKDGKIVPSEVYSERKVRFGQPTPVRVGTLLFGADDNNLLGVQFDTGKRLWLKRGFPMASCVYGDGKLIILDQDGNLTLATPTSDGLTVHARTPVTTRYSFTVPTLVGTTLYVRDRAQIMALDLGRSTVGS